MRSSLLLIGALFTTSCGASVDAGPGSEGGAATPAAPTSGDTGPEPNPAGELGPGDAPGGGSTTCLGPLATTTESYVAPSTCAAIETEITGYAESVDELNALMLGQWLSCTSPTVFGTNDEIGLELAPDGQWFKLYPDGAGGLRRGQGFDRQGTFTAIDNGDEVQLNLLIAGSGTRITVPQFAAVPRKVRLGDNGISEVEYVFNDRDGRCTLDDHQPPRGPYTPPTSCAAPTTPQSITDINSARAALAGKWALCATPSVFGTDEVGLEFTTEGEFFKLYAGEDGQFVRDQGFDRQGTYALLDNGDYVQLDMLVAGSGTVITVLQFGVNPRVLRLDNMGVFQGNYVFMEP